MPPPSVASYAAIVAGGGGGKGRGSVLNPGGAKMREQVRHPATGGASIGDGSGVRIGMGMVSQVPLVSVPAPPPLSSVGGGTIRSPPAYGGGGILDPPTFGNAFGGGVMTSAPGGRGVGVDLSRLPPYSGRGGRGGRGGGANPFLSRAAPKPAAATAGGAATSNSLHLKGIPPQVNNPAFLTEHFSRFGRAIVKCNAAKMCASVSFGSHVCLFLQFPPWQLDPHLQLSHADFHSFKSHLWYTVTFDWSKSVDYIVTSVDYIVTCSTFP